MADLGKALVGLGIITVGIGLWLWLAPHTFRLFRLPGDFVWQRNGVTFAFPITSMIVISGALTLFALLLRTFQR